MHCQLRQFVEIFSHRENNIATYFSHLFISIFFVVFSTWRARLTIIQLNLFCFTSFCAIIRCIKEKVWWLFGSVKTADCNFTGLNEIAK